MQGAAEMIQRARGRAMDVRDAVADRVSGEYRVGRTTVAYSPEYGTYAFREGKPARVEDDGMNPWLIGGAVVLAAIVIARIT